MNRILAIAFFFMIFNGGYAFSQVNPTDTNTYVIKKNNGVEYIGKILSDDGREVLILTESMGKIYIPKADITLLGFYPRRDYEDRILLINKGIRRMTRAEHIKFVDIGKELFLKTGKVNEAMFTDGLHPNLQGYEILGKQLQKLLKN